MPDQPLGRLDGATRRRAPPGGWSSRRSRASGRRSARRYSSSEWKAARRLMWRSTSLDALVVCDQQGAGGGAHEHLDPAAAGQPLQLAQEVRRSRGCRRRRRRGRSASGPLARASLSARASGSVVVGSVFGISNTAVTPPSTARARAGLQVFLPLQARLAEVDLGVDDAGQHGQARGVEHLAGRGLAEVADGGDLAVAHADVGQAAAGVVHHLAAADDQVEGLSHWRPLLRARVGLGQRAVAAAASTTVSTGRSIMWQTPG